MRKVIYAKKWLKEVWPSWKFSKEFFCFFLGLMVNIKQKSGRIRSPVIFRSIRTMLIRKKVHERVVSFAYHIFWQLLGAHFGNTKTRAKTYIKTKSHFLRQTHYRFLFIISYWLRSVSYTLRVKPILSYMSVLPCLCKTTTPMNCPCELSTHLHFLFLVGQLSWNPFASYLL